MGITLFPLLVYSPDLNVDAEVVKLLLSDAEEAEGEVEEKADKRGKINKVVVIEKDMEEDRKRVRSTKRKY